MKNVFYFFCGFFVCLLLIAYNFAESAAAPEEKSNPAETKTQQRNHALWLYANGDGKKAFEILDAVIDNPGSMTDIYITMPLYRRTFFNYTETDLTAQEYSDKARRFLDELENKKDKKAVDYVKLALLKPVGNDWKGEITPILKEVLEKFPDTEWRDWIEYQIELERIDAVITKESSEDHDDGENRYKEMLRGNDLRAEYAAKTLQKNPGTYMRPLLMDHILYYKHLTVVAYSYNLESKLRSLAESEENETRRKTIEALREEFKRICDYRFDFARSLWQDSGHVHHLYDLLTIAEPVDVDKAVSALFLRRISEGNDKDIPEDIREAVMAAQPALDSTPPTEGGGATPPASEAPAPPPDTANP